MAGSGWLRSRAVCLARWSSSSSSALPSSNSSLNAAKIIAVKKEYAGLSLNELAESPVSALQGLGPKASEALARNRVETIRDLAQWRFAALAEALIEASALSKSSGERTNTKMNVNLAVDKKWESQSLANIVAAPVDAIQGISEEGGKALASAKISTVRSLGSWKYYRWARAIDVLAACEETAKPPEETSD